MDEEVKQFLFRSRVESEWLLEPIEKTPHEYEKKRYRKRLKAIKSQAISRRANRREREKNRTEYAGQLNAVDRSAGALDMMMNPREADEQRREEANYARQLSLQESANRILQNPNSKFIT